MNEYQKDVLNYKRQWVLEEYNQLKKAGRVSNACQSLFEYNGGIEVMGEKDLDSLGHLICRTKEATNG